MRQTDLTLSELISIVDGKTDTSYPICLILNEIGEIFINKSGEDALSAEAENALVSILSDPKAYKQQIALCFLILAEPKEENKQIIKDYISKNQKESNEVRQVILKKGMTPWFIF